MAEIYFMISEQDKEKIKGLFSFRGNGTDGNYNWSEHYDIYPDGFTIDKRRCIQAPLIVSLTIREKGEFPNGGNARLWAENNSELERGFLMLKRLKN